MSPSSNLPNPDASRMIEWLSRTIAIMVVMCVPAIAGMYADDYLKAEIWTPIGAIFGFVLGTSLLLFLVTKFTPKAGGKPIPFSEEGDDKESEAEKSE